MYILLQQLTFSIIYYNLELYQIHTKGGIILIRKKIVALTVATAMTIVPFSSAFASASETPPSPEQQQSVEFTSLTAEQQKQLSDNIKAVSVIGDYIKLNDGNHYELDPEALNHVSKEVYDSYARGIEAANDALDANLVRIENGQLVGNGLDSNIISPMASGTTYWWGVNIKLSNQESRDFVHEVRTQANYATLLFGLAGILNPGAALIAVVTNFGANALANEIEYNTNSLGVNIDVSYVGTLNIYGRAT